MRDDHSKLADITPRFCPRCSLGAKAAAGETLCPGCGERLEPKGYCATCEDFWELPAGGLCPKHDVELLDELPRSEFAGDHSSLVTVAIFPHPNQANAPRIRLEAEGIPTFLDGERMAGNTLYQVATGGVRLMVPADLASSARILIDQTWAPQKDDDDLEDAWDDLTPMPGRRRRTAMKVAIILFLFGPILFVFGPAVRSLLAWLARLAG